MTAGSNTELPKFYPYIQVHSLENNRIKPQTNVKTLAITTNVACSPLVMHSCLLYFFPFEVFVLQSENTLNYHWMKIKCLQLKFLKYNFKNLKINGILCPLGNKNNVFLLK